jgi:hypothetical protein
MEKEKKQTDELKELREQHKTDCELAKKRDTEIASLRRLLGLLTSVDPDGANDDEVTRLKRCVTHLLASNDELRRGHRPDKEADLATIRRLESGLEQQRLYYEMMPIYQAKLPSVEAEKIMELALRVDELALQKDHGNAQILVVVENDVNDMLRDCTLLRTSFSLRASTIKACLDDMSAEERAKYRHRLWDCWMGQDYLIMGLRIRLMSYIKIHDYVREQCTALDKAARETSEK